MVNNEKALMYNWRKGLLLVTALFKTNSFTNGTRTYWIWNKTASFSYVCRLQSSGSTREAPVSQQKPQHTPLLLLLLASVGKWWHKLQLAYRLFLYFLYRIVLIFVSLLFQLHFIKRRPLDFAFPACFIGKSLHHTGQCPVQSAPICKAGQSQIEQMRRKWENEHNSHQKKIAVRDSCYYFSVPMIAYCYSAGAMCRSLRASRRELAAAAAVLR